MYEFLVLGRLSGGPMHGYMIAKKLEHIMGPYKQVQWGALYPVLSRLAADGLICADREADTDGTTRKVYRITDAGRQRLHEILMDTEHHLADYAVMFAHKVALFSLLSPDERRYLCRHYAVFAQQNIDHTCRKQTALESTPAEELSDARRADIDRVMQHRAEFWRAELAWVEDLIAELTRETRPTLQEAT